MRLCHELGEDRGLSWTHMPESLTHRGLQQYVPARDGAVKGKAIFKCLGLYREYAQVSYLCQ